MSAVDALRAAYRREEDTLDAVRLDRASLVSIERHFGVASPEADRARADLAEALAATEDAEEARRVAAASVLAERAAAPARRLVAAGHLTPLTPRLRRVPSPSPESVAAELGPVVGDALSDVEFADLVDRIVAARIAAA